MGEQISDLDFQAQAATHFQKFVGVCLHIPSGAEDDGEQGYSYVGNGDAVNGSDYSIRSTSTSMLAMSMLASQLLLT